MISLFTGLLFRNRATTAISAVLIAFGLLFVWHKVDKASAVRRAVAEYVADVELKSAREQIAETERRHHVTKMANFQLQERMQVLEGDARRVQQEIERYETENEINPDGIVDPNLYGRLRGN